MKHEVIAHHDLEADDITTQTYQSFYTVTCIVETVVCLLQQGRDRAYEISTACRHFSYGSQINKHSDYSFDRKNSPC